MIEGLELLSDILIEMSQKSYPCLEDCELLSHSLFRPKECTCGQQKNRDRLERKINHFVAANS